MTYLKGLGRNISWAAHGLNIAQSVLISGGIFQAATDPRRIDKGGAVV